MRPPPGLIASSLSFSDGIWQGGSDPALEAAYHEVRLREGRLLDDAIVRDLPFSGERTAHRQEWLARRASMRRLLRGLRKEQRSMTVLDVGCGNGWLAARIAALGHQVVGIDAHRSELEQAARVFGYERMWWVQGDAASNDLARGSFDRILIGAALQYFERPMELLDHFMNALSPKGELHVFDSPLYANSTDRDRAGQRTLEYYRAMDVPDMMSHYHHHTFEEVMPRGIACSVSHPVRMARWLVQLGLAVRVFPYVIFRNG